jgi:chaperonin cofactor prefoldin
MKINFNSYFKALLKENLLYILITLFLLIFTIMAFLIYFPQIFELNNKKEQLSEEIKNLKNRSEFIDNYLKNESISLYLKALYSLIPLEEDYFSIIYSLNNLSKKTSFIIKNYTINLSTSTPEKLKITVVGTGNKQNFIEFLKNYNFGGGRLITTDEISLSETEVPEISINLTFYNAPFNFNNNQLKNLQDLQKQLDKIKVIVNKVESNISAEETVNLNNEEYPKKANLFN